MSKSLGGLFGALDWGGHRAGGTGGHRAWRLMVSAVAVVWGIPPGGLVPSMAQEPQNPSPMVEHTREHPRLGKDELAGVRTGLSLGTLFVPASCVGTGALDVFIHFHGPSWIAERAAAGMEGMASIGVQLGAGSGRYAREFEDGGRFGQWLAEVEAAMGRPVGRVVVSGWSAGCGAVREIVRVGGNVERLHAVMLIDGIHASYAEGRPGPLESALVTGPLEPLAAFGRLAADGRKRMLVTHTEVFPGTYASTTETADWLLRELAIPRRAILRWGPMKTQQLSEALRGGFTLAGFAGNSAPDHVDQLHALPDFLRSIME